MALEGVSKPGLVPPVITIAGDPGAGKTTLAALFPLPLFIQAEEVSTVFDEWDVDLKPDVMPVLPEPDKSRGLSPRAVMKKQLDQIGRETPGTLPYQTLVIDSVSTYNALLEADLMAEENKATVSACSGGYNRGWEVIASRHLELIGLAKRVARRHNMALIFLSHTDIRKQKLNPDVEEHTVWDLMMPPNAANHYARLCDAILFIREEAFVRGAEKDDKTGKVTKPGKIIRTGNRIIMCGSEGHQGFTKAKNRMNLDSKIPVPFGTNPLLDLIPYYVAQNA